eukprot:CAMPEP_0179264606 /NCGR_PEP_ID=MMETSP0797-20121207/28477_1 /TAXON_ID=47934 /ORGANISM="Dinophysis acuminata, Strain DAEP01" /LENGTH=49 /DNA_ID= /DNA_START= /DNA_END= /DNA_ORIENTATION=
MLAVTSQQSAPSLKSFTLTDPSGAASGVPSPSSSSSELELASELEASAP